jgi:two-component system, OmpR family, response regulator
VKKILLVDDDPHILDIFRIVLTEQNFTLLTATSGRAALELLQQAPVDLLIADMSMAEGDGLWLIKQVPWQRSILISAMFFDQPQTPQNVCLLISKSDFIQQAQVLLAPESSIWSAAK